MYFLCINNTEELDNLLIIREHLKNTEQTLSDQSGNPRNEKGQLQGKYPECGSCRDIAHWLDKNTGDVMKLTKIKDTLF